MRTLISALLLNHSRLRYSSRNLSLKLSLVAFCHGLPESMAAVSMFAWCSHWMMARETNSGPSSERMYLGAPWMLMRRDTTSMTHRERMLPATSMARHSGGPFADHRQALELLPVGAAVEDEVVGPHLVGRLRRRWPRPAARDTLPRPLARHLELRLAPQPVGSLSAHLETLTGEEHLDSTITISGKPAGELAHCLEHRCVALGQARLVTRVPSGQPTADGMRDPQTPRGAPRSRPVAGGQVREALTYIMPSIPPGGIVGADSFFGASATETSVVMSRPAIDAAFCSAERTTFVGSKMPIFIMSPYSSVWAL